MKKFLSLVLAMTMVFSLAACGGKGQSDNRGDTPVSDVTLTAQEILDTMKEKLGESYTSATAESEDRMSSYYVWT